MIGIAQASLKFTLALTVILAFATSPSAFAKPTYGAEFTFTNAQLSKLTKDQYFTVATPETEAARGAMEKLVRAKCIRTQECKITESENGYGIKNYRVTYTDGWWFQIATDPGVVEIQTKPSTLEELRKHRQRINDDIFGNAKKSGIDSESKFFHKNSGGHMHIGMDSAFEGDAKLFRNFIVDFANHPEIAGGMLSMNYTNAPPIGSLPKEAQRNFFQIIKDFDDGKIRTMESLANKINKQVYKFSPAGREPMSPNEKYQAFNVTRVGNKHFEPAERTVEIRSLRAQASVDEFILEAELFERRLEYLKNLKQPVAVKLLDPEKMSPAESYDRFIEYVEETGLKFKPFRDLIFNDNEKRISFMIEVERKDKTTHRYRQCLINDIFGL